MGENHGQDSRGNQLRHRDPPPLTPAPASRVRCNRLGFIETPRPMRTRVTRRWQVSWLAADRLRPPSQERERSQWQTSSKALRLQLRGQPRHCARDVNAPRSLLIPCGNHHQSSCRLLLITSISPNEAHDEISIAVVYSPHSRRLSTGRNASKRLLLRCIFRLVAQSDGSLRRECLAAIGGEADIARTPPACRCEAIDPKRTLCRAYDCTAK